jgi:hypothetical protein
MAAGNLSKRADQEGDGESMRESDAEQANAGPVKNDIGASGSFSKENKREGADEFGGKLLGCGEHTDASQGEGMTARILAEET